MTPSINNVAKTCVRCATHEGEVLNQNSRKHTVKETVALRIYKQTNRHRQGQQS